MRRLRRDTFRGEGCRCCRTNGLEGLPRGKLEIYTSSFVYGGSARRAKMPHSYCYWRSAEWRSLQAYLALEQRIIALCDKLLRRLLRRRRRSACPTARPRPAGSRKKSVACLLEKLVAVVLYYRCSSGSFERYRYLIAILKLSVGHPSGPSSEKRLLGSFSKGPLDY